MTEIAKYLIPKPKMALTLESSFDVHGGKAVIQAALSDERNDAETIRLSELLASYLKEYSVDTEIKEVAERGFSLPKLWQDAEKGRIIIHIGLFGSEYEHFLKNSFKASTTDELNGKLGREGYCLVIDNNLVLILGREHVGMYYGIQTLRQILQITDGRDVPGMMILDWPDLGHRAVHYDLGRDQEFRMEFFKEIIERISSFKKNVLHLYFEEHFRFPSHPEISPKGSMTPEEARELTEYARSRYVELVPQYNGLGHNDGLLMLEKYSDYAEDLSKRADLCPCRPESLKLAEDLYTDLMQSFDTGYLHVGGDETFQIGTCDNCCEAVKTKDKGELYLEYMLGLHRIAEKLGKRMIIWGDMVLRHKEIADRLPKDIIIADWHYFGSSTESVAFFREKGFDVLVCTAVNGCWPGLNYVPASANYGHISDFVKDGHNAGAIGEVTTIWELTNGQFFQNVWYWVILSAETAWNRDFMSKDEFDEAFDRLIFGLSEKSVSKLLCLLGDDAQEQMSRIKPLTKLGNWESFRHCLFISPDPFEIWSKCRRVAFRPEIDRILEIAEECRRLLKDIRSKAVRNIDMLEMIDFIIELYDRSVKRLRMAEEARRLYHEASLAQGKDEALFERLLDECAGKIESINEDIDYFIKAFEFANEKYGSTLADVERQKHSKQRVKGIADAIRSLKGESLPIPAFPEMVAKRWHKGLWPYKARLFQENYII